MLTCTSPQHPPPRGGERRPVRRGRPAISCLLRSCPAPSVRVVLGVSALGASGAHAAALSGGGRRWEEAVAMEAKPADPQLCDSLILWVSGAGVPPYLRNTRHRRPFPLCRLLAVPEELEELPQEPPSPAERGLFCQTRAAGSGTRAPVGPAPLPW